MTDEKADRLEFALDAIGAELAVHSKALERIPDLVTAVNTLTETVHELIRSIHCQSDTPREPLAGSILSNIRRGVSGQ